MMADIVMMALADIHPYENNPRVIKEDAVKAVAASIRNFGWQQPIVVDKDNVIIVGHTRYKAAQYLGLDKAPVLIADDYDFDGQDPLYVCGMSVPPKLMEAVAGAIKTQWFDKVIE